MTLVPRVVPRNVTGQHSTVRRVDLLRDEGDAHPRDFVHTEHFEHVDVAVTSANKDQVLYHRPVILHLPHARRLVGGGGLGDDEVAVPWSVRRYGSLLCARCLSWAYADEREVALKTSSSYTRLARAAGCGQHTVTICHVTAAAPMLVRQLRS